MAAFSALSPATRNRASRTPDDDVTTRRLLEGLAAAVTVPALLAHVVDTAARDSALRARTMSYFELSLLVGWRSAVCSAVNSGEPSAQEPLPRSRAFTSSLR